MEESEFNLHISQMFDADYVAVDTEATGFWVRDGRSYAMGISIAYRLGALGIITAYFPFRHEEGNLDLTWVHRLQSVFDTVPVVFHNAKYDLPSLRTLGIVTRRSWRLYDTLVMAHLTNEERFSLELDSLAWELLKERKPDEVKKFADIFGWAKVPVGLMSPYAQWDTSATLRIFELLWKDMQKQELTHLWPEEREFIYILDEMEQTGVKVDKDFLESKIIQSEEAMEKIIANLGWDPGKSSQLENFLLNEMGFPVLKRSEKTGKPSFDKATMEKYEELLAPLDRFEAKAVLGYRGWQKACSSLYRPALALCSPDGRLRPNFKRHGTKTSRLSCEKPNLQQIPRATEKPWNGDAKRAFIEDEGYDLWGYDYSQLEFRLAAAYGRDKFLIELFNAGDRDVFSELAAQIGEARQTIKTFVYLTLYGGGINRAALATGRTVEGVREPYEAFKDSISGIGKASKAAESRAKSSGFVRLWTGRRRHFPGAEGQHKAFNSVLQGGGAEVVKRAMIAIDGDDRIDKNRCRMVLQVHDEIVFRMDPTYRKEVEPIIKHHMTNFPEFGVTFAVDGKNWTTGEKE